MPKFIDAAGEAHSVNPLSDFSKTPKWSWLLAKCTKSKREARNKLTYLAPIVTQVRPHKIWPLLAKVTFMMVRAAINAHHTIPSICFSIVSQFSYNDVGEMMQCISSEKFPQNESILAIKRSQGCIDAQNFDLSPNSLSR